MNYIINVAAIIPTNKPIANQIKALALKASEFKLKRCLTPFTILIRFGFLPFWVFFVCTMKTLKLCLCFHKTPANLALGEFLI